MKKLNVTLIVVFFVLSVPFIFSQNETDAFRYSQLSPTGTARFSSMANSMSGFGADFSALSFNPASIGVYKRSEFTFSPALYHSKANSLYNKTEAYDFKYNFNVGNLGAVFVFPIDKQWIIQFATGFNRMNNFHNRYIIKGPNIGHNGGSTSMTDVFAHISNGIADSNLTGIAYWAYQAYLIDPDTNSMYAHQYVSHLDGFDLNQRKVMQTTGSANEYVFSSGANFNDQIYIGATLGIPFFSYMENYTYSEKLADTDTNTTDFKSFTYKESISSTATGVNFKLGILYQPFHFMRFGISYHTPSFYNNVSEYFSEDTEAEGRAVTHSLNGKFNYTLTTPSKVMGDLAFIINKYGFINLHYNYTDYSTMQLHARDYDFDVENENIRTSYKETHFLGIGSEINLSPVSIRLGYGYQTNPYRSTINRDGSYHLITGGLGMRTQYFFIDFAYVHKLYSTKSVLYHTANSSIVDIDQQNQHFILTFGLKI